MVINMSLLNYIVEKLKSGVITFINAVTLANRDYPYHDYILFNSQSAKYSYVVGTNQVNAHGDQRKLFVSKSTLIYATEGQIIHLNSIKNIPIAILANTWYEFKSNIYQVFCVQPSSGYYIYFYFEGVLPQESRSAE
jgi:hypothetical protein